MAWGHSVAGPLRHGSNPTLCTVRAMPFAPFSEAAGTLDAAATAARLPWSVLADEMAALLRDNTVSVPARSVLPLAQVDSLLMMPATVSTMAMTRPITFTPGNTGTGRTSIQGDVVVFDIATGGHRLVLDGPTVTARRTAAVSLRTARNLAQGPLPIVRAGVQAGLYVPRLPVQRNVVRGPWHHRAPASNGPVLFKSCGWAGRYLAAARRAMCRDTTEDLVPGAAIQVRT